MAEIHRDAGRRRPDMALKLSGRSTIGNNLRRPESVITTAQGDVFASHADGVVMHVAPDGRSRAIGRPPAGTDFVPNGLCPMPDGSMLVANVGEDGGVWRLTADERVEPVLMDVDGVSLSACNFINRDRQGRLWLSVSTRSVPRNDAYNTGIADGFIVLVENGSARIAADGLAFANESRLSSDGGHLVVCETAARRLARFDVDARGTLGKPTVLTEFPPCTFPDGCEFDSEGHLWVASVVSNRLIRVSPDGEQDILIEDNEPARLAEVETALKAGAIDRSHFYHDSGRDYRALTSVAFGGPDLRTVYLGSLISSEIVTARSPVPGRRPEHWSFPPLLQQRS
ncbi:Sugar lactone lactonase YvrE [Faunimonas pinastri]|uniref:Sugar lactone lactonase YvrE n=1 Tax=Faunimonas pinastri TaxID=1855383 RepID=A0A1H9ED97_9HYPH|nr:SMP-30/gluconolactonase/LRE family protein [Faunimonas pinastri]SEQ22978.1 Sugar lactone lactonase YvrE [Faunimonas pinastri]